MDNSRNNKVEVKTENLKLGLWKLVKDKNNNFYLFKLYENLWISFFPFIEWLIPHKVYKLSSENVDKIRKNFQQVDHPRKRGSFLSISLGSLLGVFIANLVSNEHLTLFIRFILLGTVTLMGYVLNRTFVNFMNKKVDEVMNLELLSSNCERCYLTPIDPQIFKMVFLLIGIILMLWMLIDNFMGGNINLIDILALFMFSFIYFSYGLLVLHFDLFEIRFENTK